MNAKLEPGEKNKKVLDMSLNFEEKEMVQKMDSNSIFRLVSTGVDVDDRIRSATSVQIQHVETKGFLIEDKSNKLKVDKKE